MKLLIDADSFIYKAGCANETREYLVQDVDTGIVLHSCPYKKEALAYVDDDPSMDIVFTKYAGDLSHSFSNAKRIITEVLDTLRHTDYQLYIGGDGNFRKDLYPEYKAHRDPNARPIHEQELRQYLIKHWNAEVVHGEEADDRVSYECMDDQEGTCIVGIDKDLWNTPGWHFNPDKGIHEEVSKPVADFTFWKQMLTGDPSDNIPCIKGIGPKTAEKILSESMDPAQTVLELYSEKGHSEEYFLLMGRLLWLRRKREQIWTPCQM